VPAVCHYSRSKLHRGIGTSEIEDVARIQQSIYNDVSELGQTIRNTNHSTLVKNPEDDATGGAAGLSSWSKAQKQETPLPHAADAVSEGRLFKTIDKKKG